MDEMTLREAAERASRSITTLRRYIRNGRLKAHKKVGRYGPEYLVSRESLAEAGIELHSPGLELARPTGDDASVALERIFKDSVPLGLYHELQMKHEQLLVQYGMVRAGGLRLLELQAELDSKGRAVEEREVELATLRNKLRDDTTMLRKRLRETELELEGRRLEVAALREKVRALEMLTRNAVTSEAIEKRFSDVAKQVRRVEELRKEEDDSKKSIPRPWPPLAIEDKGRDH